MEIDAGSQVIKHVDDQQSMCRQILRPHMEQSINGMGAKWPFPGAFLFRKGQDGRRCDSLLWLEITTEEEIFRIGESEAENRRREQLLKKPNIEATDLRQYVGFLCARSGDIREGEFFEVVHSPEGDLYSHVEIELLPDFLEKAIRQTAQDGAEAENVDTKAARQIAIEFLLCAFHEGGLRRSPMAPLLKVERARHSRIAGV